MRIAMIGSRGITSDYGGIEKVLDEICPRLVEYGHNIDVYSRADIRLDQGGLRAIPVRSFGGKHLENITRSTLATIRSIGRYDVLHFHAIGPGMLALPAAALGQTSAVTIHGLDWRRAKWGALAKLGLRAAERALVASGTAVTVVSRTLQRHFHEAYGLRTSFIPNGMAAKATAPLGAFGRSLGLERGGYFLLGAPHGLCARARQVGRSVNTGQAAAPRGPGGSLRGRNPKGSLKAIEDRLLATLILVFLGPLMLLIGLLIRLDSPGPALFRQKRYGFGNEIIEVLKFRSMHVEVQDDGTSWLQQAQRDDPRITRIGQWLRRTSLDELPQLLNVLRGEMSLVGPRPHAVAHNEKYAALIEAYMARHRVKPGITGWAQVNGLRGETDTLEKMERRVQHDLHYIENWSLALDLKILARTLVVGFSHPNAY